MTDVNASVHQALQGPPAQLPCGSSTATAVPTQTTQGLHSLRLRTLTRLGQPAVLPAPKLVLTQCWLSSQHPSILPSTLCDGELPRNHHLTVCASCRGHTSQLAWVGPKEWGLWRLHGELHGPGPFQLHVAGSAAVWDLPQPLCQQVQRPGSPKLTGGVWNVLTTTSNSTLDADALAFLVLQHNTYHRCEGSLSARCCTGAAYPHQLCFNFDSQLRCRPTVAARAGKQR